MQQANLFDVALKILADLAQKQTQWSQQRRSQLDELVLAGDDIGYDVLHGRLAHHSRYVLVVLVLHRRISFFLKSGNTTYWHSQLGN